MVELRDYQNRAIEKLREVFRSGKRRPVMVLPTGAGKSIVFGQIISNILERGNAVLWIVHRRNLVKQMQDVLMDHFGIDAGIIMAGIESDTNQPAQLCTIQTFTRRMDLSLFGENRFLVDADVVLIDEAQHSVSRSYEKVIKYYKDKIIIGCSATPSRLDGRGLGEVYDSIVDVAGVKELTEMGHLSPARYFVPNKIDLNGVKTVMGDYAVKGLDGKVNRTKLIGDIVQNWLRLAGNRKTLVYAVNVKHSKAICQEFQKAGVNAEHLDARSSDEDREDVFRRMENGETTVITNVGLYTEGLDLPAAACVVIARPTKSMGLYRQMAGRGLRPYPGKSDVIILDHGNVVETHGLVDWETIWSLDGTKQAWSKPKREKTVALVKCRACNYVFMGGSVCPLCGTEVKGFGKKIVTIEAELEELDAKNLRHDTVVDKRRYLGMLKHFVNDRGYSHKMINAKYRSRYDCWPHHTIADVEPITPDQAFLNLMRHDFIKYSKQKKKEELQNGLNRGGELAASYSAGGYNA